MKQTYYNNTKDSIFQASYNVLSGKSMIVEKKNELSSDVKQMIADYDKKEEELDVIFYDYQKQIDTIQKKTKREISKLEKEAREELSKLEKDQSEKSTMVKLKLFKELGKKMSDLGYKFDGSADPSWVKKD